MAGNVFQWCADWHDPDYYQTAPSSNPTGPAEGVGFVVPHLGRWSVTRVSLRQDRTVVLQLSALPLYHLRRCCLPWVLGVEDAVLRCQYWNIEWMARG